MGYRFAEVKRLIINAIYAMVFFAVDSCAPINLNSGRAERGLQSPPRTAKSNPEIISLIVKGLFEYNGESRFG